MRLWAVLGRVLLARSCGGSWGGSGQPRFSTGTDRLGRCIGRLAQGSSAAVLKRDGSTGETSGHVGGAVQVARELQVHLPRERARRAQQAKPRVGEENPQVPGRAMLTSGWTPTEGSPPLGLGYNRRPTSSERGALFRRREDGYIKTVC
jgi:hypothetical protein